MGNAKTKKQTSKVPYIPPNLGSHRESVLDVDLLRDNEGANGEFAIEGEDGEDPDGLPGLRRALNGL